MKSTLRLPLAAIATLLLSRAAFAHPGHGIGGFAAGITHPFSGLDHLLAMLAIGLWAWQLGGQSRWLLPLTFAALLMVGSSMAASPLPATPQFLAASVLILGLTVAMGLKLPLSAQLALVGMFAMFHGYAHASEISGQAWTANYMGGLLLGTLLLQACGLALGFAATQAGKHTLARFAGSAIALAGLVTLINGI